MRKTTLLALVVIAALISALGGSWLVRETAGARATSTTEARHDGHGEVPQHGHRGIHVASASRVVWNGSSVSMQTADPWAVPDVPDSDKVSDRLDAYQPDFPELEFPALKVLARRFEFRLAVCDRRVGASVDFPREFVLKVNAGDGVYTVTNIDGSVLSPPIADCMESFPTIDWVYDDPVKHEVLIRPGL